MFAARQIPYRQTNAFSRIVIDYLNGDSYLKGFYAQPASIEGVAQTIKQKEKQQVDRQTLVEVLKEQYQGTNPSSGVEKNIQALLSSSTFTITTAHQPNLFTGPLYFIYKILHAIKLAASLKDTFPQYDFVPVYYMGSEDADFAELNHIYVDGKKIEWKQTQKGAVGRMRVDGPLLQLISELEGQLSVEKFGADFIRMLKAAYTKDKTIQQATFEIVNELFGHYGLIVLIPDHSKLKRQMLPVFEEEIFGQGSVDIVNQTSQKLEARYQAQAHAREINLFYLKDDIRERIEKKDQNFRVVNTDIIFSETALRNELDQYPERFSPNVILRGLFQETILPNIAFIGGGGELAYWLQLKDLFDHHKVVFPLLVVRNSFLLVEEKWKKKVEKLGLEISDFFKPENDLMKELVTRQSGNELSLNGSFEKAIALYQHIEQQAGTVDPTLKQHVAALKTRAVKSLEELEKKIYRAEKRKFVAQQNQIRSIKQALFPGGKLQERVENLGGFYAKWGPHLMNALYKHSLSLEQEFCILIKQ